MDKLIQATVEKGGRLRLVTYDGANQEVPVDQNDGVKSEALLNWTIAVGAVSTFTIVDYHFCDSYLASTTNGAVWTNGDKIYYQPTLIGEGGFLLNGTYHPVTVVEDKPLKPSITFPTSSSVDVSPFPVLTSTPFAAPNPMATHYSSRWQVALDPAFTTLVLDTTSLTSLVAFKSTVQIMNGVTYYVRVMHMGMLP